MPNVSSGLYEILINTVLAVQGLQALIFKCLDA
jgi:hypothetical protein